MAGFAVRLRVRGGMAIAVAPGSSKPDVQVIKRSLTLGALIFIMFFTV